jgi:hypothetical protein
MPARKERANSKAGITKYSIFHLPSKAVLSKYIFAFPNIFTQKEGAALGYANSGGTQLNPSLISA